MHILVSIGLMYGKTVPFRKVAPKQCPKRYHFTDDQMVPQGHHFGATYFFDCINTKTRRSMMPYLNPITNFQPVLELVSFHLILSKIVYRIMLLWQNHIYVITSLGYCRLLSGLDSLFILRCVLWCRMSSFALNRMQNGILSCSDSQRPHYVPCFLYHTEISTVILSDQWHGVHCK